MIQKKTQFLLLTNLILFFFSINVSGQDYNKRNTYVDALKLKDIVGQYKNGQDNYLLKNAYFEILAKYEIDKSNIQENIFFKNELTIEDQYSNLDGPAEKVNVYIAPSIASSNLEAITWQSSAINGLTTFMAERFKKELLQFSMNQLFKRVSSSSELSVISSIFPKTFNEIQHLDKNNLGSFYSYNFNLLSLAAQIDMEKVPENIAKNADFIFPLLQDRPKEKDILLIGHYVVKHSKNEEPLDILLQSLSNEQFSKDGTILKILNIADLLSQALKNESNADNIWINPSALSSANIDDVENLQIKYFYGLLYQQLCKIPEFKRYFFNSYYDMNRTVIKLERLLSFINKLQSTSNYSKLNNHKLSTSDAKIFYISGIIEAMNEFLSTLQAIEEVNYEFDISSQMITVSYKYLTITEAIIGKDYKKIIPIFLIEFREYMGENIEAAKTISLIADLAFIEDSESMEKLLDSYSLPLGSSSIKRQSNINISLNGYVGITGGFEKAFGSEQDIVKGNIGLSAPIGISTTFLNGRVTTLVSFIDLGSLVNQRLNNDGLNYSNLKFEHFLSPGFGIFYNFRKSPISTGIHTAFISNLRSIKYQSDNAIIVETGRSVARFNLSILVDIPFYTLYNKAKY